MDQKLAFCKQCQKRSFDSTIGMVCSLTQRKPDFIDSCATYVADPKEVQKQANRIKEAANMTDTEKSSTGSSIWAVIVGILAIIKIIAIFARN